MAYSYEHFVGDGVTRVFPINFDYLLADHIQVRVNNVPVEFTFINNTIEIVGEAPALDAVVEVRRVTPVTESVVDFQDGSTLEEADLDRQAAQLLYVVQEAYDTMDGTMKTISDGSFDARSARISNVATPVVATDAATKDYVDKGVVVHVQAAQVARQGAEAARDQAQTLNTNTAATAATRLAEAQQARDDARTARTGSEAARDQAKTFAQQTAADAQAVADGLVYVNSKQLHVAQLVDAGDVVTKNVGTTPGSIPVVQEDGKLSPKIMPPGAFSRAPALTANYTVTAADVGKTFFIYADGLTITLPDVAEVGPDFWVQFFCLFDKAVTTFTSVSQVNRGKAWGGGTSTVVTGALGASILWHSTVGSWIATEDLNDPKANTFVSAGTDGTNTGFKLASGADIGTLFTSGIDATALNGGVRTSYGITSTTNNLYGAVERTFGQPLNTSSGSGNISSGGTVYALDRMPNGKIRLVAISYTAYSNCNCNCNCDGG